MDKMRQEFEVWYIAHMTDDELEDMAVINAYLESYRGYKNKYEYSDIQELWLAWQASRTALCIELPDSWVGGEMGDDVDLMATVDIKDALNQAGVPYK